MTTRLKWTSERILEALYMRDSLGMPLSKIALEMEVSRNSVAGTLYRIDKSRVRCECVKPENKNGGMPSNWWRR